jgi:hypothetical protein
MAQQLWPIKHEESKLCTISNVLGAVTVINGNFLLAAKSGITLTILLL